MGLTRGTCIIRAALQRESRLLKNKEIKSPNGYKIVNEDSAMMALKGYSKGVLNKTDIDTVMDILETVETRGSGKYVATYIAQNIISGIPVEVNLENYNISEDSRDCIEPALEANTIYDRILKNQHLLEKRFNISRVCEEKREIGSIVENLCSLIDTYDIPLAYKFNIALENSLCSLVKNNIYFESDIDIANIVTEYFLTRDAEVYDDTYKKYQELIRESDIFEEEDATYGIIESLLKSDGNYFGNKAKVVLELAEDTNIKKYGEMFININSEKDVNKYISDVQNYIYTNYVSPRDTKCICYSIDMLPYHTGVNPDYIGNKRKELFGDLDCSDMDAYTNIPYNNIFDSIPNIKTIISETEAAQDKDDALVDKFVNQLMKKPEQSLFGEITGIIKCIKTIIVLVAAAKSAKTIYKVIKTILKFVDFLYAKTCSFSQVLEINGNITSQLIGLSDSFNKGEQRDAVLYFEKELSKRVNKHSDVSTTEEANIFNEFKDADDILEHAYLLFESANDIMNKKINPLYLERLIESCCRNNCVGSLYEIYSYSTGSDKMFESSYNHIYDKKTMRSFDSFKKPENKIDSASVKSLFYTIEATSNLIELSEQVESVNESTLNTIKLAIQNMKAKFSKFNMKQKELWNTLDAYANRFMRSIEDSDNNRRNNILQGKTLPSFSKCIKTAIALAGAGVVTGNIMVPIIGALGMIGSNAALDEKQKNQLLDEIEIELKVLEKEIDLAEKNDDTNKYRQLLRMQKKLQHEYQRIKYKRKTFTINIKK